MKMDASSFARLLPAIIAMGVIILASNILVQFPVQAMIGSFNVADWVTYGAVTYPIAFLVTDTTNRLLGAAAAEVVPVETIDTNFRDLEALRKRAIEVRRQGYRGMLAIHPAQVPVINEAFTPSEEEIAEAREIVELFEADPSAGTIGWKGGMLDRPHLSRARQLLAQVED